MRLIYLSIISIIFIILFTVASVNAQNQQSVATDSISLSYLSHVYTAKTDTDRIIAWARYGNAIAWKWPDSTLAIHLNTYHQSIRLKYDYGISVSLRALGVDYSNIGKYDSSILYYNKALAFTAGKGKQEFINERLYLYNNIAAVYVTLGEHKEAVDNYYKVIALAEKLKNKIALVQAYTNLAPVWSLLGEHTKALYYIDQAVSIAKGHQNKDANIYDMLPFSLLNKGDILKRAHLYDSAIQECQRAIQLCTDTHNQIDVLLNAYKTLGEIYELKNTPEKAMVFYKKALDISNGYPYGKMAAFLSISRLYYNQGQYHLAEPPLKEALQMAKDLNTKPEQEEAHTLMADLLIKTDRTAQAVAHLKAAAILRDSMMSIAKMHSINLMDAKYQTARKDKEIAEKKLTIAQQQAAIATMNTRIWSILVAASLIIIFFVMFYIHKQRLQKQKEAITAWRAMTEGEEKERIRVARELHDGIGGLLSTVKMYFGTIQKRHDPVLTSSKDYDEAMQLLESTLAEVRQTAHNLMPELLLRHGLPHAVRIFCSTIPKTGGLTIDFQYYGFIDRLNNSFELAIYRMIQELVQNVRKHAQADALLIQLSKHEHILSVTVEDNGIGMDENDIEHSSGMGMRNIKKRVEELNGSFNLHTILGKGTTVYFEFNLQDQKKLRHEDYSNYRG